jgi:hypothetical protein
MPVQRPHGAPPLLSTAQGLADCASGRCVHQQPGHDIRRHHAGDGCHYQLVSLTQKAGCIHASGSQAISKPTSTQISYSIRPELPAILLLLLSRPLNCSLTIAESLINPPAFMRQTGTPHKPNNRTGSDPSCHIVHPTNQQPQLDCSLRLRSHAWKHCLHLLFQRMKIFK